MGYTSDAALAATLVSALAALWFGWTVRHTGPWSRLLPLIGLALGVAGVLVGVAVAIHAWPDGTVVTGPVVSIYVAALVVHAVLTRLCTGLIASRYRTAVAAAKDDKKAAVTTGKAQTHLIPTVVAASTAIQVGIIANTLDAPQLYFGAAATFLTALLAWPLGAVFRLVTHPRAPRPTRAFAHPLTGLLTGATLLTTAAWALA